jgi:hypothetical protein
VGSLLRMIVSSGLRGTLSPNPPSVILSNA